MLHALLRRDRATVFVSLIAVIVLAWGYLILGAGIEMDTMDMGGGQIMLMAPHWTPGYAALNLSHVGDYDGGNDAAERGAYHPSRRRFGARPQYAIC